jgi:hypothetical protein
VKYPDDRELERRLSHQKAWDHFKKGVSATIPTARWPSKSNDAEPFVV